MQKMSFSGHESFICKQFWLKKVYDYSTYGKGFSDSHAVVDLGVGKNMVASLRYWGKSFGILNDSDSPTRLADLLLAGDGWDPYLEDIGTVWLLHYLLVTRNKASIYNLIFNEFRREKIEFTKDHLHAFLKRKCEENTSVVYNSKTITTDINVFLRNYVKPSSSEKGIEIEEDFAGVLIDLNIVKHSKIKVEDKITSWYKIEGHHREDLPLAIFLYSILKTFPNQSTIPFRELLLGINSPGSVFCLNADALYDKLLQLTSKYKGITYSETAGNQILQIKNTFDPEHILNDYYK